AGRDDNIRTLFGLSNDTLQTLRIITDHGLIINVNAQLGQALRDDLGIGIHNVAEQNLGTNCNQFCFHSSFFLTPRGAVQCNDTTAQYALQSNLRKILLEMVGSNQTITRSVFCTASSTSASTSRCDSASRILG